MAEETTRASGSAPSSDAAALARTTALAPSFSGEEFPAVICFVFGCAGSAASFSAVVSSRIDSSCSNVRAGSSGRRDLDRMDLLRQPPGVASRGSVLVRAQREGVDLLTRELVEVGHVLRRLHHLDVGVAGQQVGFGGPPAPAHIVSSMKIGPRGMNGASPFMNAQPQRDIDSTPPATPTPSSPARIA